MSMHEGLALLVSRLKSHSPLNDNDIREFASVPLSVRRVVNGSLIVRRGDRSDSSFLLLDGFVVRRRDCIERRQIVGINIPGDLPDLQAMFLRASDHDIVAASECSVGVIPHAALSALIRSNDRIARALWRSTLLETAIARAWILNVGQRRAPARLAHLILETHERLRTIGLASGGSFRFPFTQEQLGEATGLTSVHVNRALRILRDSAAVTLKRGECHIAEKPLQDIADFDPAYLGSASSPD